MTRGRWRIIGIVGALLAATGVYQTARAEDPATCSSPEAGAPMFVTEGCIDPRFNDGYAYVDVDELRQVPVPHRFVYGGFRGTDARFAFYFPAAEDYEGRFIQGPIHQLRLTSEVASQEEIEFAFDSGAYLIETNNGGSESCLTARDCLSGRYDAAIRGYRMNAAAAKFSREIAAGIYGEHRPYGYLYGGSGGAYMTVSAAENTDGVWDGYVPFVFGHPLAIPDHYTVRINALRVLRERDKFPCIVDAVEPGGSGNPYTSCGLNEVEAQAFREATKLGFPPGGWFNHSTMTGGALSLVAGYVPLLDPTYTEDFWSDEGYLGTEDSPAGDSVRAARVQHPTVVSAAAPEVPPPASGTPDPPYDAMGPAYNYYIVAQYAAGMPPKAIRLDSLPPPEVNLEGADIVVESGPGTGTSCPLMILQRDANLVACGGNTDPEVIDNIGKGDRVRIDNSGYLALQTHHRHQVPDDRDYYGWDQFRKGGNGGAIYPQRDVLVGPFGAFHASGSVSNGRFFGKMIMVESMLDQDALGWSADWYRRKVVDQVGASDVDDSFRLYFTDNAVHGGSPDPVRTVDYTGVLQQALRDLFAWVENDQPAPPSTNYAIDGFWDDDEAQVQLPGTAAARRGIQPVVDLRVVDGVSPQRAHVGPGGTVEFVADVAMPPGTGDLVCAEWDFEGTGEFAGATSPLPPALIADPGSPLHDTIVPSANECDLDDDQVTLEATHTYAEPGTYFAVLRITSQRDPESPFARVQNLDRVRIVVSETGRATAVSADRASRRAPRARP